MPQISPVIVADMLRRHTYEPKVTQASVAKATGVSQKTISNFINKGTAHPTTIENVTAYLKEKGVLTRLNLPTSPHVVPTPEDTRELGKMGIVPPQGKHYVCAWLGDWEFAQLVAAVMGSQTSEEEKKKTLGTLMAQTFSSLAA